MVRIAALGALALMIIAVIVCLVIVFKAESATEVQLLPDMEPSDIPPQVEGPSSMLLVMLVIFLIALFLMILLMSLREQRQAEGKNGGKKDLSDW